MLKRSSSYNLTLSNIVMIGGLKLMLFVAGMGSAHPDIVIDNAFLESLEVGSSSEWIIAKIGIERRKTTLPLDYIIETKNSDYTKAPEVATMSPTDLGVEASLQAISRAGISPDQIGMVIANCCTPYQTTPAESQRIAKRLNLKRVMAFDVFTACPVFSLHLNILLSYAKDALPDYVLLVSTGTLTHKVDYRDRTAGAIWGDGAAACVVSKKDGLLKVLHADFIADPLRCDLVAVESYGYFHQEGRAIRNFSVLQTVKMLRALEKQFELDWNRDVFIGHQANYTMLTQITGNRKIPDKNHWHNVIEYGNQAGASCMAVLSQNWEKITSPQKIVISVVGAGLSWGSTVLEA
ncbi:MAG: ketoacyl-ACP synthase III [Candidatus Dadabacteria bacterium]|nr:MAG: ketoacyl-ACP synthase III [Candidatus Dadabacteria bacterium]